MPLQQHQQRLDYISEKIDELKKDVENIHNKLFIGNGQKALLTRMETVEGSVLDLEEHKNNVLYHMYAIFGGVGSLFGIIITWLLSTGSLQWVTK